MDVAEEIGRGLRTAQNHHCVVVRSTVTPGTTRNTVLPTLEKLSGRRAGSDFGLGMNPEFLREATAVRDFRDPPYTIIGALDERSAKTVEEVYAGVGGCVRHIAIEEAELLKLLNNSFHALKVGFANEVGRLAEGLGLDSHRVMDLVCADTKLNISSSYLTPGFAFGGSCLPKDVRALAAHAHAMGTQLPILSAVLPSNGLQVDEARRRIQQSGARRVGVLGLSFKAGTDDVRESPLVSLIRSLWQDGYDVTVYDPDIQLHSMLGANRDYLERQLPQIQRIIAPDIESVVAGSDLIVVGQKRSVFHAALSSAAPDVTVLDLVRLQPELSTVSTPGYQGLSW
jgi:GDP-mannose 6-dehydrogenase